MQKYLAMLSLALLTSCHASVHFPCVTGPQGQEHVIGYAYIEARHAALCGALLARDLTDEEIDRADDAPGSGYHDSQKAAENPPTENA